MKAASGIQIGNALAVLGNRELERWFKIVEREVTDPASRMLCEAFVGVPVDLPAGMLAAIHPDRVVRRQTGKPSPARAKPRRAKRDGWNQF